MSVSLSIKVIPSSGRQALSTDKSGQIKCALKSPPEDGKANAELIKFLSKKLKITQECVKILQGQTSRKKTIKIDTQMTTEEVMSALGVEVQMRI